MLVSYNWLKEYVDLSGTTPEELAEKITRTGIEVESVESVSEGIEGVVVGYVMECEQHPNADKLNKCLVDIGEGEPVQIICGAKNVAKGQKVAVAKVGAVLPGNFKIKKAKLRGEESNGMICSLQELGYESKIIAKEYAEGIYVFPEGVEVGQDAIELLNLNDHILELGLTPNRSDCLSMLGVAYEVAAILEKDVKLPHVPAPSQEKTASQYIDVRVDVPEDNPLYVAKIVKNVKIGPSPLWLQTRLMAAGIRPHNNIVDITNYILLEYGTPLHAFDYDRFGSKEIVVRRAKQDEKIVTLDDAERTLTTDHLVITNGNEPVAVAGVMGGANSEVRSDTTTVILEAALFNPQTVRKGSKDLGLRSEASSRFEKGIDPERVRLAAERAAALMAELGGGEVVAGSVEVNTLKAEPKVIEVPYEKVNRVLGTDLSKEEMSRLLDRLKIPHELESDRLVVTAPTRRGDLAIQEDIIEEIGRLYGYDNLPYTLPVGEYNPGKLTSYQRKRRVTRQILESAGLYQVLTYSLTSKEKAQKYALEVREPIALSMPMSEERSHLRLSLLPGLIEILQFNQARQNESLAVYEIGSVFLSNGADVLPKEKEHLAGALTGVWVSNPWQGEKKAVDFYVAKGVLDALFEKLDLTQAIEYTPVQIEGMHPGRTAQILLNGTVLGFVGQLHPTVQKEHDLKDTFVFEMDLSKLLGEDTKGLQYLPIPRYPSITRDIALIVDSSVLAGDLQKAIASAGGKLLKEVSVFDVYQGEHVESGKKSIAFSLKYVDPEKTLTDEEVTAAHEKVLQAVKQQFGATLRGA
ncbi:phenylalanine--tRNA ligase subunit beta [Bacillus litorisediminis]|uniref:phenylalanine--tRNA ligase subunit beta n=1 Tax=Bacillus litorisediminis TaxID=2922713 RepID=UPI001FB032CA|nr:phenylalanine--tRNA ligase subunit beta [Bacillus litorisediminis]